jgi:hypothetical protein
MRLAEFSASNIEAIVLEWVIFARDFLQPPR